MSNDLREALQALYDVQHSPPLLREQIHWSNAMRQAEQALAQDDLQRVNERPNADVIRAYADGHEVFYNVRDNFSGYLQVYGELEIDPKLGDEEYEWYIGELPKQKD